MFTMETDTDKVAELMIEDYFKNVRHFCTQKLSRAQVSELKSTGTSMIDMLVKGILEETEPDQQVKLFHRIKRKFMLVLQDYDRKWVWSLLSEFESRLPERMLN